MNPDSTSLDRLHDIVVPPPVPWWPPAPGCYGLGGFVLFLAAVAMLRFIVRWQANCYRREALKEWAVWVGEIQQPANRAQAVISMAVLLKRAALTAFPRERVASLTGTSWLSFLDLTGRTNSFSEGPGHWLEKVAYDPRSVESLDQEEARQLAFMVRHWLAGHRTDVPGKDGA